MSELNTKKTHIMDHRSNEVCFSAKEKKALIRILKGIAVADNEIKMAELNILKRVGQKLNISTQEFVESDKLTLLQAASALHDLSPEKKQYVANMIALLIIIDGDIDAREMAIGAFVTSMCDLPEANAQQALIDL